MSDKNKTTVRRLIDEVMNAGRLEVLDELCSPAGAAAARRWIAPFRAAFPDVHMTVIDMVAEDDKVAARFTCSGTQHGAWQGRVATGRRFVDVDEVYFFSLRAGKITQAWGRPPVRDIRSDISDSVARMRSDACDMPASRCCSPLRRSVTSVLMPQSKVQVPERGPGSARCISTASARLCISDLASARGIWVSVTPRAGSRDGSRS